MKLFLLFFTLVVSPVFCSELNTLWDQALHSSNEENTHLWESWISKAQEQQIAAPEAYFNLAYSHWQKEEVALSVKNLLMSAQLRSSLPEAYGDLNLLTNIQRALVDVPSPIESFPLKSFFLLSKQTETLGKYALLWLGFLSLFLRLGFNPGKKKLCFVPLGVAATLFLFGLSAKQIQKDIRYPSILSNQKDLVPVYASTDLADEKPTMELPSGLLVIPQTEKEDWIRIEQPAIGWIKKEMALPFPKPLLVSSNTRAVYE